MNYIAEAEKWVDRDQPGLKAKFIGSDIGKKTSFIKGHFPLAIFITYFSITVYYCYCRNGCLHNKAIQKGHVFTSIQW